MSWWNVYLVKWLNPVRSIKFWLQCFRFKKQTNSNFFEEIAEIFGKLIFFAQFLFVLHFFVVFSLISRFLGNSTESHKVRAHGLGAQGLSARTERTFSFKNVDTYALYPPPRGGGGGILHKFMQNTPPPDWKRKKVKFSPFFFQNPKNFLTPQKIF